MRRLSRLLLMLIFGPILSVGYEAYAETTPVQEVSICGFLGLEAAMFEAWRDIAVRGPLARKVNGFDYSPIDVKTSDRRSLKGYRISAKNQTVATRAILVLQGNAVLADQLRVDLTYFAGRGFDVFIFDYRGYGKSNGTPLLKPISLDQALITEKVRGKGYKQIFLYGISMGGIYSLGPHMPINKFEAVAIDSTPAKLPWYSFCPSQYDPIANVPSDASNVLVISGGRDEVISASDVEPLGRAIEAHNGKYRHVLDFGHPLMDSTKNTRNRFRIIADFFEGKH
ncbi:MAG: alpha/beta hydrolase [Alphaproteobacteria bacterium]